MPVVTDAGPGTGSVAGQLPLTDHLAQRSGVEQSDQFANPQRRPGDPISSSLSASFWWTQTNVR